jgi:broad specificity phosphatase PhoE
MQIDTKNKIQNKEKRMLIIFRHGQTDLNKQGLVQGTSDFPLNLHGISQAQQLASALQEFNISHIFSSIQRRAVQTAEIVSSYCDCGLTVDGKLQEQDYGAAEGKPVAEMRQAYPEYFLAMDDINHPETNTTAFPRGETRQDVFNRAGRQIKKLVNEIPHGTVGISTHGGTILSLMSVGVGKMIHIKNGGYVKLYYDGQDFSL